MTDVPRFGRQSSLAAFSLGVALVATMTAIALYSNNTLQAHPDWVASKLLLAKPVMGAEMLVTTRNLLQRNRLNLGSWHGFQEVLLDRIFRLGRLRFRFQLDEDAYLYVVFNGRADGFSAIRMSRSASFPSAHLRVTAGGRFLDTQPLPNLQPSRGWHTAELTLGAEGASLAIDGARVVALPTESPLERQVIGFRGGARPARVDDVRVEDAGGNALVATSFANWSGAAGFALTAAALLLAIRAGFAWMSSRGTVGTRPAALAFLVLEVVLLTSTASYLAFDYFLWSGRYHVTRRHTSRLVGVRAHSEIVRAWLAQQLPFVGSDGSIAAPSEELKAFLEVDPTPRDLVTDVVVVRTEDGRQRLDSVADSAPGIRAYRSEIDLSAAPRIMLLGSSQTWGAGAVHPGHRLAARLQHHLAEALEDAEVFVINAGQSGTHSFRLLERFRSHLHLFQPQLVVVNLSNNDHADGFAESLSGIVRAARSGGAEVLFVLEANSPELDKVGTRHAIMSETAAREGVPVVDLHAHLASRELRDSGILWWDNVHLTSWGQELAGRFLASAVRARLPASP